MRGSAYVLVAVGPMFLIAALGFFDPLAAGLGVMLTALVMVALIIWRRPSEPTSIPLLAARRGAPGPEVAVAPEPHVDQHVEPPIAWAPLIAASIAVHTIIALVMNLAGFDRLFADDVVLYSYCGKLIAESFETPSIDPAAFVGCKWSFYRYLNGLGWAFLGSSPAALLGMVNGIAATIAAFLAGKMAEDYAGSFAARRAFLLIAFFPSLLLWSSLNLRDAWAWMFIAASLYGAQKLRQGMSLPSAAMLAVGLIGTFLIRQYLAFVIGLGLLASFMIVRVRQVPYVIIASVIIVFVLYRLSQNAAVSQEQLTEEVSQMSLETIAHHRDKLARGKAAYDVGVDISTPAGALVYLPLGVLRFLLSPFPWTIRSWRQATALPEVFAWYFLLIAAIRGIITGVRTSLSRFSTPIIVLLVATAGYGLVEGNEGTAYRHRAQIMVIAFIFSAVDAAFRRRRVAIPEPSSDAALPEPEMASR